MCVGLDRTIIVGPLGRHLGAESDWKKHEVMCVMGKRNLVVVEGKSPGKEDKTYKKGVVLSAYGVVGPLLWFHLQESNSKLRVSQRARAFCCSLLDFFAMTERKEDNMESEASSLVSYLAGLILLHLAHGQLLGGWSLH